MRTILLLALACGVAAHADDLPPPPSAAASLLVLRHELTLKEPLDLRPTPSEVEVLLKPRGARRVYSDQRLSIFLVAEPGEFLVGTATATFRPKRQSGLVGNGRSERPEERWELPVDQYEVGRMGLPVVAGSITYAGTLKLTLRRMTDDNQPTWGIAPQIVDGVWGPPDADDVERVEDLIEGTGWSGRKVVRLE
jgi:hypothetical protein